MADSFTETNVTIYYYMYMYVETPLYKSNSLGPEKMLGFGDFELSDSAFRYI